MDTNYLGTLDRAVHTHARSGGRGLRHRSVRQRLDTHTHRSGARGQTRPHARAGTETPTLPTHQRNFWSASVLRRSLCIDCTVQ